MTSETGVTALTNTSVGINGGLETGLRAHSRSFKSTLALSGVGIALVSSLASPAYATEIDVNDDNDTVTVSESEMGPVTTGDVQNALDGLDADADANTLDIEEGAEVVGDGTLFINIAGDSVASNATDLIGEEGEESIIGFSLISAEGDVDFLNTGAFSGDFFGDADEGLVTYTNNGSAGGTTISSVASRFTNTVNNPNDDGEDGPPTVEDDVTTNVAVTTSTVNQQDASITVGAGATNGAISVFAQSGTSSVTVNGAVTDEGFPAGVSIRYGGAGREVSGTTTTVTDESDPDVTVVTETAEQTQSQSAASITFAQGAEGSIDGDVNLFAPGGPVSATVGGLIGTVQTDADGMETGTTVANLNITAGGRTDSSTIVTQTVTDADGSTVTTPSEVRSSMDSSGLVTIAMTEGSRITGNIEAQGGDAGASFTGTGGQIDGGVLLGTNNFTGNPATQLNTMSNVTRTAPEGVATVTTTVMNTAVGGDVAIELTDFTVGTNAALDNRFRVFSGSGAIDFTAMGSTFGDDEGDLSQIFLTSSATDTMSTQVQTDDGDGSTSTSTVVDNTAAGGDITVALMETSIVGGLGAFTSGGTATVDIVDTTIDGIDGVSTGFLSVETNTVEGDSNEVTTNTNTSVTSMDMLTRVDTVASTFTQDNMNTNVGGDLTTTISGSTINGDITLLSGPGDNTLDIDASLLTDILGEAGEGDTIFVLAEGTDLSIVQDNSLSTVTTTVDSMDATAMSSTQTVTTVVDNSLSRTDTRTAVGGDVAITITDSAPIFTSKGELETLLGVYHDIVGRSTGGTVDLTVTDSTVGDVDTPVLTTLDSRGSDIVDTNDSTDMSTTVDATTVFAQTTTATTTTDRTTTAGTSAGSTTSVVTQEVTDVGGDVTVALTDSSLVSGFDIDSGAGAVTFGATGSSIGDADAPVDIRIVSAGANSSFSRPDVGSPSSFTFDNTSASSSTTVEVVDDMMAFVSRTTTDTSDSTRDEETINTSMSSVTNVGGDIAITLTDSTVVTDTDSFGGGFVAQAGSGSVTVDITDSTVGAAGEPTFVNLFTQAVDSSEMSTTTSTFDQTSSSTTVTTTTPNDMMVNETTIATNREVETTTSSVSSSSSERTAVGGDITGTITGSTIIGDYQAATNGPGNAVLTVTDSTFAVDGGSGDIFLNTSVANSTSQTDTTSDSVSVAVTEEFTDAMGDFTAETVTDRTTETTFDQVSTSTNVGGDVVASFNGSSVDGGVFATSGAGDVTITGVDTAFGTDGGTAIAVNATSNDTSTTISNSDTDIVQIVQTTEDGETSTETTALRTIDVRNSTTTQTATGGTVTLDFDADTTFGAAGEFGSFNGGNIDVDSDQTIIFNNVGRIGGDVDLRTQRSIRSLSTNNSLFDRTFVPATAEAASLTTTISNFFTETTDETVGGMVDFTNSGVIGDPQLFGFQGVTFLNTSTGIILDSIFAQSAGFVDNSTTTFTSTTVVPGALPSADVAPSDGTFDSTRVFTRTTANNGGDVSYTNEGSVGALGINRGGVFFPTTRADTDLFADGNITIDISGVNVGNVNANAGGFSTELTQTTVVSHVDTDVNAIHPDTDHPTPGPITETETFDETFTQTANETTVVADITGRISNNAGSIAVNLNSAGGDSTLTTDGARIEGDVSVRAGDNDNITRTLSTAETFVDADGFLTSAGLVEMSFTSAREQTNTNVIGDATATIVDTLIGDLDSTGHNIIPNSGSLSVAASGNSVITIDAGSTVAGSVFGSTFGDIDVDIDNTERAFGADGATNVVTTSNTETDTGGTASANVAGAVLNRIELEGEAGADLILTGRSDQGFSVLGRTSDNESSTELVQAGPRPGVYQTVTQSSASSNTWKGGAATALVDTSDDLVAGNIAAVSSGSIEVVGFTTSDLTITSGSQVFTTPNTTPNVITVGGVFTDGTSSSLRDFAADTNMTMSTGTIVGGNSNILNDGLIGVPTSAFGQFFDANSVPVGSAPFTQAVPFEIFDGSGNVFIGTVFLDGGFRSVFSNANQINQVSVADATFENNGTILANYRFNGLFANTSTTVMAEGFEDTLFGTTVHTDVFTPVGGNLVWVNNGILGGNASAAGANATLTNNGSARGSFSVGGSILNTTSVTTDNALTQDQETVVTAVGDDFVQTYLIDQNALLVNGVSVNDAGFAKVDGVQTLLGSVVATVNLNNGSFTGGGVNASFDKETGERFTSTVVNLNGAGFLGSRATDAFEVEETLANLSAFAGTDPLLASQLALVAEGAGSLAPISGPVTVRGVDELNKNDAGTFVIYGSTASFGPGTPGIPSGVLPGSSGTTAPTATGPVISYTIDAGVVNVNGGLLELDVTQSASPLNNTALDATLSPIEGTFGVRGDIVNSAGLTLGRTVPIATELFLDNIVGQGTEVFRGIQGFQTGDFTQTGTGTLNISVAPDIVRAGNVSVGGGSAPEIFGFAGAGVARPFFTTLDRVDLPSDLSDLSTSYWVIDGDLDLGGTVNLGTITNSLFVGGQTTDIFRVSGDTSVTANVTDNLGSRFVSFSLGTRAEGDDTVVFIEASRASYASAAGASAGGNPNAAAAASGLDAALPSVVSRIVADSQGQAAFATVEEFALAQDLATVFAALDTQLTDAQITQAFNELSSAEVYGSLAAVRTTDPFGTWTRSAPARQSTGAFFLWGNVNANFEEYDFNETAGASGLDADQYGGSAGLGFATESDILFGIGAGYSQIDATDDITLDETDGDTYTVGAWVNGPIGPINFGLQAVFGWTNWDSVRTLPLFARTATASFDSTEFRANARVGYDYALSDVFTATPFIGAEIRTYDFEGFVEEGAGGIGLAVEQLDDSVFSPEIGVDFTGELETGMATLLPRLSMKFVFQGDLETARDVTYLGDQNGRFSLVGVNPENFFEISGGLEAKIGERSAAFIQAAYATGDDRNAASVGGGVRIGF